MPKNCIKAIRQKKNMTREQLAALVDLQPEHIALFENGYMVPLSHARVLYAVEDLNSWIGHSFSSTSEYL